MDNLISHTTYRMSIVFGIQISVGLLAVAGFMSFQPGREAILWITPAALTALASGLIVLGLRRHVRTDETAWTWTRCVLAGTSCVMGAIALGAVWGWGVAH